MNISVSEPKAPYGQSPLGTDELLKVLTENGCRVYIGLSEFGGGFDLQINTDEGIVYHDPHCESVQPGLLEVWSQILDGRRLVPIPSGDWQSLVKGSGPDEKVKRLQNIINQQAELIRKYEIDNRQLEHLLRDYKSIVEKE